MGKEGANYKNNLNKSNKESYNVLEELKETIEYGQKIRKRGRDILERIKDRRDSARENLSYKGIERRVNERRVIPILFLMISLFFLSTNITGFVIGNLNQSNFNWIGGIFFVFGLVGLYFW